MVVCYSVNDKYYDLFEVSLKSLLKFNNISKLYVIFSKLRPELINRTQAVCNNFCDVEFKYIDIRMFNHIKISYLGVEAYYRLLIPTIIEEDKVWYIDCDTLILGSIEKPYHKNIDYMISAVPNPHKAALDVRKKKLRMSQKSEYFNSGVLLLNLTQLRNSGFFQKVIDWRNSNINIIDTADQDALNAMLNGHFHKLDAEYNVTTEVVKKIRKPIIIHFTGEFKPNLFLYQHPYKNIYMQFFSYNKESFAIKENLRYIRKMYKLYIFKIATKLPCLMRIYNKLKQ